MVFAPSKKAHHNPELLQAIRKLIAADLEAVDQLILDELNSKLPLIQNVVGHIIRSGGKRIRPIIVLLVARSLGYNQGMEHQELATIIEFIHTSTLLHDDVVDASTLRRGQMTANEVWGNSTSVLVGDFLYSRVFQMLTQRNNIEVMRVLADTTNLIAEGEVLQLMNRHNSELKEKDYLEVIYRKTAKLFEAACEIGAIVSATTSAERQAAGDYGRYLGLAFQITDDVLDYQADQEQLGKNIGDDLAEGKMTLPLIQTLAMTKPPQAQKIRAIIKEGDLTHLNFIIEAMQDAKAYAYCLAKAREYAQKAQESLNALPNNPYRSGLRQLIDFVVNRDY